MSTPPKRVNEPMKPTQVPITSRLNRKPKVRSQNLNRTYPPAPAQSSAGKDIDDNYSDSEAGELTINQEDEGDAGHEWGDGYEDDEYGGEVEGKYTSQLKKRLNELLASSQNPTKKRKVQGRLRYLI